MKFVLDDDKDEDGGGSDSIYDNEIVPVAVLGTLSFILILILGALACHICRIRERYLVDRKKEAGQAPVGYGGEDEDEEDATSVVEHHLSRVEIILEDVETGLIYAKRAL